MMMKAIAILYPEGANVRIPFEVELHSGYDEGDLNDIVNEMFPHLEKSDCYGEFIEENPMAKLEELKAAAEAARDDARAAVYDALDAVVVVDDEYVADAAAWDAEAVLAAAADAACDAYEAELKKKPEEMTDE
jgi:hypothetical protein